MDSTGLPVLWLSGPSAVGKTTVGWELFTRLAAEGIRTGYVDIDQLGMCYAPPTPEQWAPEPSSDPVRYRMKAQNLDAVVPNFRAAGARCLVVSGIVDPHGADTGLIHRAELTLCRLRAEPADLRRRIAARGRPEDDVEEILRYADALESLRGACIDTTGHDVAGVLRLVRERIGDWPGPAREAGATEPPTRSTTPGEVLWLTGVTAVGKSTVGWEVYRQTRLDGEVSAFVDLQQIGFLRPESTVDAGNHRLKAGNLAALWQAYHARGARRLVVVGPVERPDDVPIYRQALPAARITVCRLHADPATLAERVAARGRGISPAWGLAGDDLSGRPDEVLHRVASRAAADAEALEAAGVGDIRVDSDHRPPAQIAREILEMVGAR